MLRKIAIVVASGNGTRMGSDTPKQFMLLRDRPVLVHTLEKVLAVHNCEVILALSKEGAALWEPIALKYLPHATITVVIGGETRFHSVRNALHSIEENGDAVVAIHDGVRPFLRPHLLSNSFAAAEQLGAAVACVDSKDSVRITTAAGNQALERRNVKLVQTPQTFRLSVLRAAYEVSYHPDFTDDASVVEHSGHPIHLIEGDYSNIKITTPEDLLIAEVILNSAAGSSY